MSSSEISNALSTHLDELSLTTELIEPQNNRELMATSYEEAKKEVQAIKVLGDVVNVAGNSVPIQNQTNKIYLTINVPDNSTETYSNLPAMDDPNFEYVGIQHNKLVKKVTNVLITSEIKRVALYGQFGTGKSAMALQIAALLVSSGTVKHTFWIPASNSAALQEGYRKIAGIISLPKSTDPRESLNDVRLWLSRARNGPWLVVLDDCTVRPNPGSDAYEDRYSDHGSLIPQTPHGHLIITTSHSDTARKEMGYSEKFCFEIPKLQKDEAVQIIKKRMPSFSWTGHSSVDLKKDAEKLVQKLDKNPSALVVSARYIDLRSQNGETIPTYLNSLRRYSFSSRLSEYTGSGLDRSPFSALASTYDKISTHAPQAIELLALMSCLDRRNIPRMLLCCYNNCDSILRDHLALLSGYMLVVPKDGGKSYTIPALVQRVVHEWLHAQNLRWQWQIKALDTLYKQYQNISREVNGNDTEAYIQQRQLQPHIEALYYYCRDEDINAEKMLADKAPAIVCLAGLCSSEGRYKAAMKLLEYVSMSKEKEDAWRILALKERAEIIRCHVHDPPKTVKELQEARNLLKNAREIAKKIGNKEAEMDAKSFLALNYSDAGRNKRAETYQEDVVKYLEEKPVPEDGKIKLEVLGARLRLAKIYRRHGRDSYKKKPYHLDRALRTLLYVANELCKEIYSQDDKYQSLLFETQASLAKTYYYQGEMRDALDMARKAYLGRLYLFGHYDLWTLKNEQDLAFCLLENGIFDEAKERFENARERLSDKLGPGHYEVRESDEKWKRFLVKLRSKQVAVSNGV